MSTEISSINSSLGYERTKLTADVSNSGLKQQPAKNEQQDNKLAASEATKPTELGTLVAEVLENQARKKAENADSQPENMSAGELKEILNEINSALYSYNRSLKFELYDETEDLVVKVLNTKTDEIIRQYPSEEVLQRRTKLMAGETNFFSTEVS